MAAIAFIVDTIAIDTLGTHASIIAVITDTKSALADVDIATKKIDTKILQSCRRLTCDSFFYSHSMVPGGLDVTS